MLGIKADNEAAKIQKKTGEKRKYSELKYFAIHLNYAEPKGQLNRFCIFNLSLVF